MTNFLTSYRKCIPALFDSAAGLFSLLLMVVTTSVLAEGSYELINGGSRPFLEYCKGTLAGIDRKTAIYVYARAGEKIQLGSSAIKVGAGAIKYSAPDGTTGSFTGTPVDCKISNITQEAAGPNPPTGYTPCELTVGATQEGIWKIEFISPSPTVDCKTSITNTDTWTQVRADTYVIAWDVTVRNTSNAIVKGRAYANYLALNMGAQSNPLKAKTYIKTKEGALYSMDLNGIQPFGANFFANNKGFKDSANNPIYRSLQFIKADAFDPFGTIPPGYTVHNPGSPDTATDFTHKIFFNYPDATMPTQATPPGGGTPLWLNPSFISPLGPEDFRFEGTDGTVGQAGTTPLGGYFKFTNPGSALSYSIKIDVNHDGTYGNSNDRVIVGATVPGLNQAFWDVRDGNGNVIPAGIIPYDATIELNYGEVHFPILDAEQHPSGFKFQRLEPSVAGNPADFIYYDDGYNNTTTPYDYSLCKAGELPPLSLIYACYGTAPAPRRALNGTSSTAGGHSWNNLFGNVRGIDTWAYVPSVPTKMAMSILIKQADLSVTKTYTPDNPAPGNTVTYTMVVKNGGFSDVTGIGVQDEIPAALTSATWTCEVTPTSSGNRCAAPTGTNSINTTVDLQNGSTATFTVTGILKGTPGTPVSNAVTVTRPNDVTNPQGSEPDIRTETSTVTFTIATNIPPVAAPETAYTNPNTPITIDILKNDSDADNGINPGSVTITTPPAHGTVTVDPVTGSVTYTPAAGFNNGTDTFTYQVCDKGTPATCSQATVTVTVPIPPNLPPVADNKTATTPSNRPVQLPALSATDPNSGDTISAYTLTTLPAADHGILYLGSPTAGGIPVTAGQTLTPAQAQNLFFQPQTDSTLTASFTYTATDQKGAQGNPAKVEIAITEPLNTPPRLQDDAGVTVTNTPVTVDILKNDNDVDGGLDLKSLKITTPPAHGNIVINDDGTLTYTPNNDFTGTETVTYEICDNSVPPACVSATVTLTVSPPLNTPPVADDKTVPAIPNNSIGQLTDLMATDKDGSIAFYTILTLPAASDGVLYLGNPATGGVPVAVGEILTPEQKGQLYFKPDAKFEGTTQFTFKATDNLNAESAAATVTITVTGAGELPPTDDSGTGNAGANIDPVVSNDNAATNPNEPVKIRILDNDSDADNGLDRGSVSISVEPKKGQVKVNADGTVTYTPNPDFVRGQDTFVYRVCDNADPAACDTAIVTVLVPIPENLPPVADDKTLEDVPNDQAVILPTLAATDSDGTIASFTIETLPDKSEGVLYVGHPAKGGVAVTAGQVMTPVQAANLFFMAKTGFNGSSDFTFTATDNEGAVSDPATMTVTVVAGNGGSSGTDGTSADAVATTLTVTIEGEGAAYSTPEGISCTLTEVTCTASYDQETPVTLTAVSSNGWRFSGWEGDCDEYGLVSMTTDKHCTAVFVPLTAGDDQDGVPASLENGLPCAQGGDGNHDGIPDAQQSDVASLPQADGNYLTVFTHGCPINKVELLDSAVFPATDDLSVQAPLDLLLGCPESDITLYYYAATDLCDKPYRHWLPTVPGNNNGGTWQDLAVTCTTTTEQQCPVTKVNFKWPTNHLISGWALETATAAHIRFAQESYTVTENGGSVTIAVQRLDNCRGEVGVDYLTQDGTATLEQDYRLVTGHLTWADGDCADKYFTVPILEDTVAEAVETVKLSLFNVSGHATIVTPDKATVMISDNDGGMATGAACYATPTCQVCCNDCQPETTTGTDTSVSVKTLVLTLHVGQNATVTLSDGLGKLLLRELPDENIVSLDTWQPTDTGAGKITVTAKQVGETRLVIGDSEALLHITTLYITVLPDTSTTPTGDFGIRALETTLTVGESLQMSVTGGQGELTLTQLPDNTIVLLHDWQPLASNGAAQFHLDGVKVGTTSMVIVDDRGQKVTVTIKVIPNETTDDNGNNGSNDQSGDNSSDNTNNGQGTGSGNGTGSSLCPEANAVGLDIQGNSLTSATCFNGRVTVDEQALASLPRHVMLTRDAARTVEVTATILVDPQDVGKVADILLVGVYTTLTSEWRYTRDERDWTQWDDRVSSLPVAQAVDKLPASLTVPIFKGDLSTTPGEFTVFIGYRLANGSIIFNGQVPIHFYVGNASSFDLRNDSEKTRDSNENWSSAYFEPLIYNHKHQAGNNLMFAYTDTLTVSTLVRVDSRHVGQAADILMVAVHKSSLGQLEYTLTSEGWQVWDRQLSSLKPFQQYHQLPETLEIPVPLNELLVKSGEFIIYVGYRVKNTIIVFNGVEPLHLTVANGLGVDAHGQPLSTLARFISWVAQEQRLGNPFTATGPVPVTVATIILVDPAHVGQTAAVLMVAVRRHEDIPTSYQRVGTVWAVWDEHLDSLQEALPGEVLEPVVNNIEIFTGSLGDYVGDYTVYVGYRLSDGSVFYNGGETLNLRYYR